MTPSRVLIALVAAALPLGACATTAEPRPAPVAQLAAPAKAKNVILFIGDGMGISTITAARIYEAQKRGETGEENSLSFEKFPNVALVKTYNTNAQVPDSAGTATAMHSGLKTRIGVLGIGPDAEKGVCTDALAHPLPLLGEEVKQRGLALGIVTTTRLTHATPASVVTRSADRDWEADSNIPADQQGQGCKDIALQFAETQFDVALGGGTSVFYGKDKERAGRRSEAAADLPGAWAAKSGGTVVKTAAELAAAPMDKPVLGLFNPSHLTYMADRKPDSPEPTLTDMTATAITRLSADPDGFYLMVEGGRIDHAHHGGQAGYALEEAVEFARAVQYAVDNTDPAETLIMVTADHSHVFTIAGYPQRGNDILGLVVPPAGRGEDGGDGTSPVLALDGKPYTTLGYANGPGAVRGERQVPETGIAARQQSLVPTGGETHAGEDVALFATGPGAQRARGVIEQNVIYNIIRKALGWEE
ncbi:alkaline phosphatase [Porphyrobacter sp. AAP60]|uniref:alkaline phosphatase n=1 Tax=Porphyrobacter sp. AAP60 TaxID=1523423 RepID=UPI0006B8D069|nr:alkaline phosphatase [Porphyrobacter sp. AAP60]KPF63916.1 alkaline phosphatase [Porphyrobacter sp. AAP60]